jgi:2-dehydropantoate 2-reductase
VLGIAANMFEPAIVNRQVSRSDTWITVGTYDGEPSSQLTSVRDVLQTAAVTEIADDIRAAKWMKLIANIPEMLPSAILGVPLLTAVDIPGVRDAMDEASREAYALATDLGITMVPIFGKSAADVPDSDQYALELLDAVLKSYSLSDTRVAVLQDWDKRRHAELDAYNGYIVASRRQLGGNAPVNEAILQIAQRIEAGELEPSLDNAALLIAAREHAAHSAHL